jgi:mono/diheme cytochrome c family protein
MNTRYWSILLFLPLLTLFAFHPFKTSLVPPDAASATPTYDPLAEPPLPPNPTEYELGRNLYWHWCMTCHGDRGQGLTDEFRGIWPPDHQNCWGRGCHSGRRGETGFPIPTVVPALVDGNHLTRFSSEQELADFLEATHPPQNPGILKKEEYQAIALFVFAMNGRLPVSISPTDTATPSPTRTILPDAVFPLMTFQKSIILISIMVLLFAFALIKTLGHTQ